MTIKIIEGKDICTLCNKEWKHRVSYCPTSYEGLKEAILITSHANCRTLIRKKKDLEKELLDLEWKIYTLQNIDLGKN